MNEAQAAEMLELFGSINHTLTWFYRIFLVYMVIITGHLTVLVTVLVSKK